MMADVRYEPDHVGFGQAMMDDEVAEVALYAARQVVLAALTLAPRSDPGEKGQGDGTSYVEHFEVNQDVVSFNGSPRRSAVVINDADYAAQVEFGLGYGRVQGGNHGTPSRVLGRAGAMVGEYKGGAPG